MMSPCEVCGRATLDYYLCRRCSGRRSIVSAIAAIAALGIVSTVVMYLYG